MGIQAVDRRLKSRAAAHARRLLALSTSTVLVSLSLIALAPAPQATAQQGSVLLNEDFTGESVADPAIVPLDTACLTAAPEGSTPPAGSSSLGYCTHRVGTPPNDTEGGWLQLTDAENYQLGGILYNKPLSGNGGLDITFQQYQFGGTGADGIGFFLVDGSTDLTTTGGDGGSLGYAQVQHDGSPRQPGVLAGYLGLGLDAYGNYANDGEARGDGCAVRSPYGVGTGTRVPNAISLRGPVDASGNANYGYCWLATERLNDLAGSPQLHANTLQDSERTIRITVSADEFPTVTAYVDGQEAFTYTMTTPAPATYKFGFSSSTGGSNDVHLIRALQVHSLEDLGNIDLVKQVDRTQTQPASYTAGDVVPYQFLVTNPSDAVLSNVTVTDPDVDNISCPRTTLDAAGSPNASMVCTGTHTITADEAAAGTSFTNTATASGSSGGTTYTDTDSETVPITPAPGIKLSKSATLNDEITDDDLAEAGETISYSYTVSNTGNTPLTDVGINDALAGPVTCVDTTIPVGGSTTCTADEPYTVGQSDVDRGVVHNSATAVGTPPNQNPITSEPARTDTPTVAANPSIAVTKDATLNDANGNGYADPGETITYTFRVVNNGNVTLSDIGVTDPKVGPVTCPEATLAPRAETTCTADPYTVTEDDVISGSVSNTATATGTPPTGPPQTDKDGSEVPTAAPNPSLALRKHADLDDTNGNGVADVGEQITYSFTVRNNGNLTVSSVGVNDNHVSPVTCDDSTLAPGEATTCTADAYTVTQSDVNTGFVHNIARASGTSPTGDTVRSNRAGTYTPTVTAAPSIALIKHADLRDANGNGSADAGEEIVYSFEVINTGNVTVHDVTVEDDHVSPITCPDTTLDPGDRTTCTADAYTVTQRDVDAGVVHNTATASATSPRGDDVPSEPSTTDTPTTAAGPSLGLVKSAHLNDQNDNHVADVGETISYSFEVTNNGNVTISGITVDDDLVGPVTCPDTTLAPGDSTTCTADNDYTVTQDDVDTGTVHNSATASGTGPGGGDVTSNPSTEDVPTVGPNPALTLMKRAHLNDTNNNGLADPGETIAYFYDVKNSGNVTISDLSVADQLAGSVTCPDTTLAPGDATTCTADTPYTVTEADLLNDAVHNSATASGTPPGDGEPTESNPSTTDTPTVGGNPSLAIVKSAELADENGNNLADAGETITYTYQVTNNGNLTISGVAVDDPLAGSVTCPETTLAPDESTTCTADSPYTVTQADVDRGHVPNKATASGTASGGEDVTSEPSTTDTPTVNPNPSIALQKHAELHDTNGNGTADVGEEISFSFVITNNGNVTVTAPRVTDHRAGDITCPDGSIAPGDSITCTADERYTVTQDDVNSGTVHNHAVAHATPPGGGEPVDSNPAETDTPTVPQVPLININKTSHLHDHNGNGASVGEVIDYRFKVTNLGNVTLTDISVNDDQLGTIACPKTTLQPHESMICTASHTTTQADVDAGAIYNRATATGTPPSGNPTTSQPSDEVVKAEPPNPALSLTKQANLNDTNGNGLADAGETIRYHFTIRNSGNMTIRNVTVNDALVGAVNCPGGPLAPGSKLTCTARPYTVTRADMNAGRVHNVAIGHGLAPVGDTHDVYSDHATANVRTSQLTGPAPTPPPAPRPPAPRPPAPQPPPSVELPNTGAGAGLLPALLVGVISLASGGVLLLDRRRWRR